MDRAVGLEEKRRQPCSRYVATGLYFYDERVVELARSLELSGPGEIEITDINKCYLTLGELRVAIMGGAWPSSIPARTPTNRC